MAAGIEQFAGDWYVDVDVEPDNELVEALFGPVIIERKLGLHRWPVLQAAV